MTRRADSLDLTTTITAECWPPAPVVAASTRTRARFVLLFKARGGMQVSELGPAASIVVGRAAPAELIIDDSSLSRMHARLHWHEDGVVVEDLGSKNGLLANGVLVERMLVQPGAAITLGNVELVVRQAHDIERRCFDDFDRFCRRIEDELLRARTLTRPLSLLMLRALSREQAPEHHDSWWLRARAELRPIDTIAVYAPSALLILLPELGPAETRFVAQTLVHAHPGEPALVCGIATLQQPGRTPYQLIEAASRAARVARAEQPVVEAEACTSELAGLEPLIVNANMQELYRIARRVASHPAPLLILGETGTGKELVARHAHAAGSRRDKPFRAINCGAIPATLVESVLFGHERGSFTGASDTRKGVFEEAHGGTLFLDEIGELPLPVQAALLRVLETKQLNRVGGTRQIEVDVRIVSATHCDLDAMVARTLFRADLYHRLNLLTVHVPPLRERLDEIEPLALRFLRSSELAPHVSAQALTSAALEALRAYAWPGNVRELRNVIERAALLCDRASIDVDDLPERVRMTTATPTPSGASGRFADLVRSYEIQLISEALRSAAGNQTRAAELLDMPLRTLVYKIRSYGLRNGSGVTVSANAP